MTPIEHLKDVSKRIGCAPDIVEQKILTDEVYLLMLEGLNEELEFVIKKMKGSNVVNFPRRRRSSLGLKDQGQ